MSARKPRAARGVAERPAPPAPAAAPTVDLLPPEVRARRALRSVRHRCALVLVAAVVLTGAVCFWGVGDRAIARSEREAAEQDSQRLLTELATYAEVDRIKSDITRTRQAIAYGMRNEVLWGDLVDRFAAALPDFAWAEMMDIAVLFDVDVEQGMDDDPFVSGDSIGDISWVIEVPTLAQAGDLIPALDAADGLFDTTFTRVERVEGEGVHRVIGSVRLDATVRSGRFTSDADGREAA